MFMLNFVYILTEIVYLYLGLYQDLVIPVTNFHNENKGLMVLAGDVFDVPIRKDIIHRVVLWQLAKRQQVLKLYLCLENVMTNYKYIQGYKILLTVGKHIL